MRLSGISSLATSTTIGRPIVQLPRFYPLLSKLMIITAVDVIVRPGGGAPDQRWGTKAAHSCRLLREVGPHRIAQVAFRAEGFADDRRAASAAVGAVKRKFCVGDHELKAPSGGVYRFLCAKYGSDAHPLFVLEPVTSLPSSQAAQQQSAFHGPWDNLFAPEAFHDATPASQTSFTFPVVNGLSSAQQIRDWHVPPRHSNGTPTNVMNGWKYQSRMDLMQSKSLIAAICLPSGHPTLLMLRSEKHPATAGTLDVASSPRDFDTSFSDDITSMLTMVDLGRSTPAPYAGIGAPADPPPAPSSSSALQTALSLARTAPVHSSADAAAAAASRHCAEYADLERSLTEAGVTVAEINEIPDVVSSAGKAMTDGAAPAGRAVIAAAVAAIRNGKMQATHLVDNGVIDVSDIRAMETPGGESMMMPSRSQRSISIDSTASSDSIGSGSSTSRSIKLNADYVPCAVQGRLGGYKGVWYLDSSLPDDVICVRPSMKKIDLDAPTTTQRCLEVMKTSGLKSSSAINVQFALLLEALGGYQMQGVLKNLLWQYLSPILTMWHDEAAARQLVNRRSNHRIDRSLVALLDAGCFADHRATQLLKYRRNYMLRDLAERLHIPVSKSRTVLILPDPTGLLGPQQVYFRCSSSAVIVDGSQEGPAAVIEDNGFAAGGDHDAGQGWSLSSTAPAAAGADAPPTVHADRSLLRAASSGATISAAPITAGVISGNVVIIRNPCHSAEDAVTAEAVSLRDLGAAADAAGTKPVLPIPARYNGSAQQWAEDVENTLVEVILLPVTGDNPMAQLLSGGDYDGDMAWICWEPSIVEPVKRTKDSDPKAAALARAAAAKAAAIAAKASGTAAANKALAFMAPGQLPVDKAVVPSGAASADREHPPSVGTLARMHEESGQMSIELGLVNNLHTSLLDDLLSRHALAVESALKSGGPPPSFDALWTDPRLLRLCTDCDAAVDASKTGTRVDFDPMLLKLKRPPYLKQFQPSDGYTAVMTSVENSKTTAKRHESHSGWGRIHSMLTDLQKTLQKDPNWTPSASSNASLQHGCGAGPRSAYATVQAARVGQQLPPLRPLSTIVAAANYFARAARPQTTSSAAADVIAEEAAEHMRLFKRDWKQGPPAGWRPAKSRHRSSSSSLDGGSGSDAESDDSAGSASDSHSVPDPPRGTEAASAAVGASIKQRRPRGTAGDELHRVNSYLREYAREQGLQRLMHKTQRRLDARGRVGKETLVRRTADEAQLLALTYYTHTWCEYLEWRGFKDPHSDVGQPAAFPWVVAENIILGAVKQYRSLLDTGVVSPSDHARLAVLDLRPLPPQQIAQQRR